VIPQMKRSNFRNSQIIWTMKRLVCSTPLKQIICSDEIRLDEEDWDDVIEHEDREDVEDAKAFHQEHHYIGTDQSGPSSGTIFTLSSCNFIYLLHMQVTKKCSPILTAKPTKKRAVLNISMSRSQVGVY